MASTRRTAIQDRARESQKRVLEGASEAFSRLGYGETSMRTIAEASGMSLGTVNFHFGSKQQIAFSIIEEQHHRAVELIERVDAEFSTAVERLVNLSLAFAKQLQQDRVVQAGFELSLRVGIPVDPALMAHDPWREAISRHLQQGLESGGFVSELTVPQLTNTYLACISGVGIHSRVHTERADLLDAIKQLWVAIIPGLVAPQHIDSARRALDSAFGEI